MLNSKVRIVGNLVAGLAFCAAYLMYAPVTWDGRMKTNSQDTDQKLTQRVQQCLAGATSEAECVDRIQRSISYSSLTFSRDQTKVNRLRPNACTHYVAINFHYPSLLVAKDSVVELMFDDADKLIGLRADHSLTGL